MLKTLLIGNSRPNLSLHKCVMYKQHHNSDGGFKLVVNELRSDPIKRLTPPFNVPVAIEAIVKNDKAVFLAVIIIITDLLKFYSSYFFV